MSKDMVSIDEMSDTIMKDLTEYASVATDDMKQAVRDAGNTVKKQIQTNAPVDTGAYKKSWTVTKVSENSSSLDLVVHSKNRYQLAHLLEHGHAKRGGGRVEARPHIAPAEESGKEQLLSELEKALQNDA